MLEHKVVKPPEMVVRGITSIDFLTPEGEAETVKFSGFYAGLAWLTAKNPGYAVVFGKVVPPDDQGRGVFHVLKEITSEELSQTDFLTQVSDISSEFGLYDLHADLTDEDSTVAFREFMESRKRSIDLEPGAYMDNLFLMVSVLRDWLTQGSLKLHEGSIIREQLRKITREDFKAPLKELEANFFAVSATRFTLGIAHQERPRYEPSLEEKMAGRGIYQDGGDPHGWMSG